jgi:signal peptidase II
MQRIQRFAYGTASGIILLGVVDRILKAEAINHWAIDPLVLFPGARFTLLLNRGIAFSMPVGDFSLAIALSALLLALCLFGAWVVRKGSVAGMLGVWAVFCGAMSNIADRFLYGGVVDFVEIGWLPLFNIADLCIMFGVALLLWALLRSQHHCDSTNRAPSLL